MRLVKARGHKNKSEVLRRKKEERLEEHPDLVASDKLQELINEAGRISDAGFDRLAAEVFRGRRTAAELVGEGRESRWAETTSGHEARPAKRLNLP